MCSDLKNDIKVLQLVPKILLIKKNIYFFFFAYTIILKFDEKKLFLTMLYLSLKIFYSKEEENVRLSSNVPQTPQWGHGRGEIPYSRIQL